MAPPPSSSSVRPENLATVPAEEAQAFLLTRSGRRFRTGPLRALVERIEADTRTNAARALALADTGLDHACRIGDDAVTARFLRSRGHALRALNRYREALRSYDRAVRAYGRAGQQLEAAITQIGRIDSLMYLGRYDEALAAASQARRKFLRAGERVRVARLDTNTGNLFHRRDLPSQALRYYDRARRVFARQDDPGALGLVELNRGNVLSTLGRTREAREAYLAGRSALARASMTTLVAQTDYSLAYVDFLDHRLPEALEALEKVRPELERLGERRMLALCYLDAAEIHLRLGLWREARIEAETAAGSFGELSMRYEQAKAHAFAGAAYLRLNRLASAVEHWNKALPLFEAERNDAWSGQLYLHLAGAALRRGDPAGAERLARQALARLVGPELAERRGFAQLTLAEALRARGSHAAAHACLARALVEARRARSPWLRHEALFARGQSLEARGDASGARRAYRAAAREGERLRALLSSDDFRAAFHRGKAQPYLALAALDLDAGAAGRAFAHLERGRARALLDLLSQVSAARRAAPRAAQRRVLAQAEELLKRIGSLYHRARVAEEEGKRHLGTRPQEGPALARDEAAAARLLSRLAAGTQPALAPLPRGDFREVQAVLRPGEVLIEYFILRGQVGALVVGARSLRAVRDLMSEVELGSVCDGLRFQWGRFGLGASILEVHRERSLRETHEDLAALRHKLWDPLVSDSNVTRAVIVPVGPLHGVPWAALGGADPLVRHWALAQAPSAEVFLRCRRSSLARGGAGGGPAGRRRGTGGAAGRPVGTEGAGARSSFVFAVADEFIPEVTREAAAVARLLPRCRVLSGPSATVQMYRRVAPRAVHLHLAAHGVFRRDQPLFSGIRLADRWMSAYDVRMTPLSAQLVTLSACGTARSEVWAGEEWMGLVRAFLSAGATRVLAGLWEVNDAATRHLMEAFYAGLREGREPAEALQHAQSALAREDTHPYRWAGFLLVGDL